MRIGCSDPGDAVVASVLAALASSAFAAHPLLTEDTGTQGAGNSELELGFSQARDGGAKAIVFGPQLSYGAFETLDVIARPTWLSVRGTTANPDASRASWLTVARFGAIATVTRGFDVDAGYQVRLARAAPVQIVLAGATLRW